MPSFSSPGKDILLDIYPPVFSAAVVMRIAAHFSLSFNTTFIAAGMHASPSEQGAAFVAGFNQIAQQGAIVPDLPHLQLMTPFADSDLADLLALGYQLGVPLESTWSCDQGYALQCGRCPACLSRQAAFSLAQVPDRARYSTPKVMAGNVKKKG